MSTTEKADNGVTALNVVKNEARRRFEIDLGDGLAFLRYAEEPGVVRLIHTEVPEQFGGRGIAGKLAAFALDEARSRGLHVIPTCPYVRAYIERHPEYADLVALK